MPIWSNVEIKNPDELRQFNIELNKRIRYYLGNINVSQILFQLNDIGGTLNLSKGGTGYTLSAPAADSVMFYDVSEGHTEYLTLGNGVVISGTTLSAASTFTSITSSSATIGQLGSTGSITTNTISASSAKIGQLGSTGSITANTIASSSAVFSVLNTSSATIGQLGSTGSATFNTIGSSSATMADVSSTNLITANKIASSSGIFGVMTSSSASIGQLGSTGSISANTLNASSASLPLISSTNKITCNSIASSSIQVGKLYTTDNIELTKGFILPFQTVVGASSFPDAYNLSPYGFSVISSSSGCMKYYLLGTPSSGQTVDLYCKFSDSTSLVYVYASATCDNSIYFGQNTSQQIAIFENGVSVRLLAMSTNQWIAQYMVSNSTGRITFASSAT